ncbi:MAG TPA: response regulator [Bryobacteraceae bacterium]|nr:response regulator [Bryobacteraceae bacterium]
MVEDNKADVFLIRQAIQFAHVDADVFVVHDGQVATQFVDAADRDENAPCPNLILLDMNLPKKSGDDVLKHLRNSRRCAHAQVLIVSSSESKRDREAVAGFSVAGYFRKPSEHAEFMKLGGIVKRLLDLVPGISAD